MVYTKLGYCIVQLRIYTTSNILKICSKLLEPLDEFNLKEFSNITISVNLARALISYDNLFIRRLRK